MEPTYHLEGVIRSKEEMEDFEGPLNLILMLLSKNKIEIRDIQVSLILDQYLEHLAQMEAMDLEIASEFVQMASHLVYIKTKMLLTSQDEEVSELELLMTSLEQMRAKDSYTKIKDVLPEFARASEFGALYHTKQPEPQEGDTEYHYRHEGYELLKAISDVFLRIKALPDEAEEMREVRRHIMPRPTYNVLQKSREIIERLRRGSATLRELYALAQSRSEVVATFISVLEMCSKGNVALVIDGDDIVASFIGGDTEEILQSISEE